MLKHGLKAELEILSSCPEPRTDQHPERSQFMRHSSLKETSVRRPLQPLLLPQPQSHSQPIDRRKGKERPPSLAGSEQGKGDGEPGDGLVSYVQRKLAAFLATQYHLPYP